MLQAAFGSRSGKTEGEPVNWIFQFFPMYFNKNDNFRVCSLQAKHNPFTYVCIFSFVLIMTSSE